MRSVAVLVCTLLAAAGVGPAADRPAPRPAEPAKPLSPEARAEIRGMLPHVTETAKPRFSQVCLTIEQARHYANVSPKLTWQAEYGDWFVFACPNWKGL